jgi:thioredoxin 1
MTTTATVHPTELTEANFESFVTPDGIAIVDFWATWCGPCRAFAPVFEAAAAKHPDIRFGKLDTEAQQGIAAAFEIQAIPTLMVFRDNILLYNEAGALPSAGLEQLIEQVRGLDMNEVRREATSRSQA